MKKIVVNQLLKALESPFTLWTVKRDKECLKQLIDGSKRLQGCFIEGFKIGAVNGVLYAKTLETPSELNARRLGADAGLKFYKENPPPTEQHIEVTYKTDKFKTVYKVYLDHEILMDFIKRFKRLK